MNRIEEVFGVSRVLLPVIHAIGWDEALASIEIAAQAGVRGVVLIDQGTSEEEILGLALETRRRFPALWVGMNLLARSPSEAVALGLEALQGRLDGIWCDNAAVEAGPHAPWDPREIVATRRRLGWTGLYFGGVAFKYQRAVRPEDLARVTAAAVPLMDVVCTSGPATGQAASLDKVRIMSAAVGRRGALALASGVTAANVEGYLPFVGAYLVASGIEAEFGRLDPDKLAALRSIIDL